VTIQTSRKERKRLERAKRASVGWEQKAPPPPAMNLKTIKPMTRNQNKCFGAIGSGKHLLISGYAGTGKSFIGTYLALRDIEEGAPQERLIIVRSAVQARNQGFLPGTDVEKAAIFEAPYRSIVDDLYGKEGAYNRLKDTKVIEFMTTSFLRGITLSKAFILFDEVQNATDEEINAVITRAGEETRVILCGDRRQNDLEMKKEFSGMGKLLDTVNRMESFEVVDMQPHDIVRSGLVKEWILARG
jgi:phosphate starvation-inducible protein PhoH and related proteins